MPQIQTEQDAKLVAESIADGTLQGLQADKAMQMLEDFKAGGQRVGDLEVNTTPIELPPPIETAMGSNSFLSGAVGLQGTPMQRTADTFSPEQRADAARGVDIKTGLQDNRLRSAIGFSPNQAFTADFLARNLSEKTGLPASQVLRANERGGLEFFNPDTKRFTSIDGTNFSKADLRDFYGPSTTAIPAIGLAIAGGFAGPGVSIAGGGFGAFIGESLRLIKGKELGVHDLDDGAMFLDALKAGAIDTAGGVGGQLLVELRIIFRTLAKPTGITPDEARNILSGVGKNADTIENINSLLARSGSKNTFKLDPVADAEDALGLEAREAASRTTNDSKALRASELKANDSALDEYGRRILRVKDLESDIITNEGAEQAAKPAQAALTAEKERIQSVANRNLVEAEDEALSALGIIGKVESRGAMGGDMRAVVAVHAETLENTKTGFWVGYQKAIGQQTPLDEGFEEAGRYVSNVQVPITPEIAAAHRAVQEAKKQSLLTRKAQGAKTLRGTQPTTTTVEHSPIMGLNGKPLTSRTITTQNKIDLAVLDDDIKEIRDVLRSGDPKFRTRKMRVARDNLVKLRNEYLRKNDPDTLALLEKAEEATRVHANFVNEGVFASILKTTPDGKYVLNDVAAFKSIFLDKTGESMKQLVEIGVEKIGGKAALQATALQVYKANVIPEGGNLISLDLHNKFIRENEEVLRVLFDDPKMLRFGHLEAAVARTSRRAEMTAASLSRSPLAKLGGIAPENMGKAVFEKGISQSNVRTAVLRLKTAGSGPLDSFKDSVGRHIYRQITTDGAINPTKISTFLESHGGKISEVFGAQFVSDLKTLRKGIILNLQTQSGPNIARTSLIGQFARSVVTPPLTRRGRLQTFVEKYRYQAANRMLNQAVRDPDILNAIIRNANRDIRDARVLNLLGQIGATSLALEEQQ